MSIPLVLHGLLALVAKVTPNDSNKNRQRIKFTYDAKIEVVDSQISALKG